MCTSFIHRSNELIVGMNFDNNGMRYQIDTRNPDQFTVLVDGGVGLGPSFGVNNSGMFINNLLVDSNGKGSYKRPGKKTTHTVRLVKDVLDGTIPADGINGYLSAMEVTNTPNGSFHNMICDAKGNVWVVEPGRGKIYSPREEKPYFVMSNFSLCDYKESGRLEGVGTDRFNKAEELLEEAENMDVKAAFKILAAVAQKEGEWLTDISLVYSHKEGIVYYCINRNFEEIHKFSLIKKE